MTDGTSQGLFIVVAIVIFGIFVVLAYILFEDSLSPALASIFTDATETASKRLQKANLEYEEFGALHGENGYVQFDFRRLFVDEGVEYGELKREIVSWDSKRKVYVIPYNRLVEEKDTTIVHLYRMYILQDKEKEGMYNVVNAELFLDGTKVDANYHSSLSPITSHRRYFLTIPSKPVLERNREYLFEIKLHLGDGEILTFEIPVMID